MPETLQAKIAVAALFWWAVFLVQTLNWGAGAGKALALLALLIGALWLALREVRPHQADDKPARALTALAGLLLLAQLVYFGLRFAHPHLIDMATTTLDAGNALIQGRNPYTMPIDTEAAGLGASPEFQGYKYLPLMPAVYLPLGLVFGARGLLATNLLLLLATLGLMQRLCRDAASPRAGLIACLLYLSIPLAAQQVLVKGSTDLVAVTPLLLGFVLMERRPGWAGFCVGLSIAAKLFPGALFLPCLLPAGWPGKRRYVLGIALGLLPIVPYALASPAALYDNIVLFNAIRAPDSTSWLASAPDAAFAARSIFFTLFAGTSVYIWRRAPGLAARCGLGAMLALGIILAGPAAHHNYHLWWLPFYCVSLAAAL